jgi:L-ascorbate metabolism protein UlaG (beta-lactamase superfamily)
VATTIRFLGGSGYQLVSPTHHVLIDPWLSGNPVAPDTPESIERPDVILVTHAEFDHFGDTAEIAQRTKAPVVCDPAAHALLLDRGIDAGQLVATIWGMVVEVVGLQVRPVESRHNSRAVLSNGTTFSGTPLGFIVETEPGIRVYHWDDTAIFDMRLIGSLYEPTVGILGCSLPHEALTSVSAGRYLTGELSPDEAARAAEMLGVSIAIGSHYLYRSEDVDEFVRLVGHHDSSRQRVALAMEPGETIVVDGDLTVTRG